MKSTTNVWIAIRNIGDSQDRGDTYNGTLTESILWLATKLRDINMAGRIVVGLGRKEEDALRGIDVKNAGRTAINDDMKAMLDSILEDDGPAETDPEHTESVPGDDYVP